LRVELASAATVHWSPDDWRSVHDTVTHDSGFGIYVADLDTASIPAGGRVAFTLRWAADGRWEGADYQVAIE
jgi:glucoamylase